MGSSMKVKVLVKRGASEPPAAKKEDMKEDTKEDKKQDKQDAKKDVLTPQLAALLRAHTFHLTKHTKDVGKIILDAFLSPPERLVVPSTAGAMPCSQV